MSTKTIKQIAIYLGVAVLLVVVWFIFVSGGGESDELLVSEFPEGEVGAQADGGVLSLLHQLRSIELDESLFEDPAFTSLQRFDVEIEQQPTGRQNPFAPIGVGGAFSTTSPATND